MPIRRVRDYTYVSVKARRFSEIRLKSKAAAKVPYRYPKKKCPTSTSNVHACTSRAGPKRLANSAKEAYPRRTLDHPSPVGIALSLLELLPGVPFPFPLPFPCHVPFAYLLGDPGGTSIEFLPPGEIDPGGACIYSCAKSPASADGDSRAPFAAGTKDSGRGFFCITGACVPSGWRRSWSA